MLVQEKGQAWGLWSFPGGHVDSGELYKETAIREAKEETGYDIEITEDLGNTTIDGVDYKGGLQDNDKKIQLNFFKGRVVGGELSINKNDSLDVKWFSKEELNELPLRGNWLKPLLF